MEVRDKRKKKRGTEIEIQIERDRQTDVYRKTNKKRDRGALETKREKTEEFQFKSSMTHANFLLNENLLLMFYSKWYYYFGPTHPKL